jgi:Flp pilus assembly protein TadG
MVLLLGPASARLCRRFIAARRGVAAIEFAAILPMLLLIFLGAFDAGNAISIYMKVRSATFTLATVTNQYQTMQTADMTAVTGATAAILAPYSSSPATVTISQIKITSSSNAAVSWSYSLNGTARTQGSSITLPSQLASNNSCGSYPCYLILSEVSYAYSPMFTFFIKNALTLSDYLYVAPRSSACIVYISSC